MNGEDRRKNRNFGVFLDDQYFLLYLYNRVGFVFGFFNIAILMSVSVN